MKMHIPEPVRACMDRLEAAGYATYLVGGCVRDAYLGLTPHDFDMTTAALPEQTEAVFKDCKLVTAGKKHGTIGVVTDCGVVEITTFRLDGNYTDSRHPTWVKFVPTIEEDLARRDFTAGAMAYSPTRGFADPFGGRADLDAHILRAVGVPAARFEEDALRILRGVRFSARFGLQPEPATLSSMIALAPTLDSIARERVFEELSRFLLWAKTEDLLTFAPILAAAIPEIAPMIGFDQHSPHHAWDVFTHVAHVVDAVPRELPLRWAALLHDIGKPAAFTTDETGRGHFYGHAKTGAEMADTVLRNLKAPTALREEAVFLISQHMTKLEPDKKLLRRRLSRLGEERLLRLLALQEADSGSKGIEGEKDELLQFPLLRRLIGEILSEDACLSLKDLAVNGNDLMALGLTGKKIGQTLNFLLEQVLEENLPNHRDTLLTFLKNNPLN